MQAIIDAARAIRSPEADLVIAGGVESMSRSPFVIGKAAAPFDRSPKMEDTTMGWRFVNPKLDEAWGTETMPQTAENLAREFSIDRADQDAFALWSQQKAALARKDGSLAGEIVPVEVPRRKQEPLIAEHDEHPRETSLDKLASLRPLFADGTVTAGNASGINDGAAALLLASEDAVRRHGLQPLARVVGTAFAGVPPRIMGYGPVPATRHLLARLRLGLDDLDVTTDAEGRFELVGLTPGANVLVVEAPGAANGGRPRVAVRAGEVRDVGPGDCVLIPAGVAHSYENRGSVPIRFLCIVPITEAYETEWLEPAAE